MLKSSRKHGHQEQIKDTDLETLLGSKERPASFSSLLLQSETLNTTADRHLVNLLNCYGLVLWNLK